MTRTRTGVGLAVAMAMLALGAAPTYAHDCFNPAKNEYAPSAGVHHAVGLSAEEKTAIEKVAQGKGIGGFLELNPEVTGAREALYVHTIGHSESHETVGGPGSEKEGHSCNGKGIDYLEACATGG